MSIRVSAVKKNLDQTMTDLLAEKLLSYVCKVKVKVNVYLYSASL